MSRGVGAILLNYLIRLARDAGVRLRAEFKANGRNRLMYVTYRFANFKAIDKSGEVVLLENDCERVPPWPDYVEVRTPESAAVRQPLQHSVTP
jgi:GNAT superfamily N-acetyltransferase